MRPMKAYRPVEPARAQEHPTHRQATQTQDGGEGQTLSLRQVSEAKPKARENTGAVVLSEVPCRDG